MGSNVSLERALLCNLMQLLRQASLSVPPAVAGGTDRSCIQLQTPISRAR
jgi:hypothetical protein